jgi:isopenicillin-N N-acyltransferase like protein
MQKLNDQDLYPSIQNKEGHTVLHIEGTPFEMGFQHGSLLKEKIHQNIRNHLRLGKEPPSISKKERTERFLKVLPHITTFIPEKYIQEMEGVAKGADASFNDILLLNLFPEMFHCCAVTASKEASADGSLYHARVLDYSEGKDLQSSAVLIIAKPNTGYTFINVSYAGFIGTVTGMNEKKIAIGEIGGDGYEHWSGMPMSFLLRSILEDASSLNEAKEILKKTPRTCEYYYIISDGKTDEAFSCYATDSKLQFMSPGQDYSITPPLDEHLNLTIEQGSSENPKASFFKQEKDMILLTGLSSPERYPVLLERACSYWGLINETSLMDIIQTPVSRESNLHNAIFHPSSLTLWVSHAGKEGEPACTQPYVKFSI